ncbi:MAG TPA: AAA domain-containing protein [Trebonia sp.]|nr:AAA domain-containing protein [Trebonia sp.]
MTEPTDARRLALVAAAQRQWIDALTDLGGRNTLLYYKDRRAGTLDLGPADPDAVERFEKSGHARLTRLFPGHENAENRADAIRRAQAIYRKARELHEERGIRAGYLATGMARWDELFLEPAAPVLLRGLTMTPTRARYDDFELVLDDDTEVNPVLLHKLATVYGATVDKPDPQRIAGQLARAATQAEVPGFAIERRKVIGTFTYAKLPMVRDLEAAGDLLADSDLVAAIAGDPEAQAVVSADLAGMDSGSPSAARDDPARDDPASDFSVLDADSSQRAAIEAALAGRSLVIHGPPGTGKSQTIANLIAAMVARGRKVLFVAEKRAAIDAVLSRMNAVGLGDLVLDIHEGTRDRQRIAAGLGATLDQASHAPSPDTSALHRRLTERQRRLARHGTSMHRAHEPWGLSPYQVQSGLLSVPPRARVGARLATPELITPVIADELRDELREFTRLGGLALRPEVTPWFGAGLPDREAVRDAVEEARALSARALPQLSARLAAACQEAGLRPPSSPAERDHIMSYLSLLRRGEEKGRGFRERRALRKEARATWETLRAGAAGPAGLAGLAGPEGLAGTGEAAGEPRLPRGYPELARDWAECERRLTRLRSIAPFAGLQADPEGAAAALLADEATAWRLPRLHELARRFAALGLGPVIDEIAASGSGAGGADPGAAPDADLVAAAFDYAWYRAILDEIRVRDPEYAADDGAALDQVAEEFRRKDTEHLAANRARVRGVWAGQLRDGVDRHPLQARVIRKQAALRRGHLPLRRLLDQAGDVLFALKPCWALSPLMVSQVLPLSRLFDLVIFDEASQVVPADAIGSIIRAHQVVVAGDDRQLPPTSFFRQADAGDLGDDDDDEDLRSPQPAGPSSVALSVGFESILDALRPLLPTCPLTWHYRSRDERLVAFSNDRIYGGSLTTFPGVARDDCLRHVVVAQRQGPGQEASVEAEVDRVVSLVVEQARTRPAESLGVIALGMRHAERIDAALRAALASGGLADVEAFFAEDATEPFFVKNLERVQGDERDAIILSVGYGKHADGRMRYQWGPLLRDGGERRLNVAATRARRRLTVVSSFSSHDVDQGRLTKAGARMLAEYLEYARSGGTPVAGSTPASSAGAGRAAGPAGGASDAFTADVAARLALLGIEVLPQYGVGGYRVDFAAAHPDDPSRMILAVEADGTAYRDSGSVRDRDRLRKEHLERLGWRVYRLWSTSWLADPEGEMAKLTAAYAAAVAANPVPPPPVPSDPVPSDPVSSDPVSSGPVSSEPVSSGPVVSGLVVSGLVVSGPVGSDPVASVSPAALPPSPAHADALPPSGSSRPDALPPATGYQQLGSAGES